MYQDYNRILEIVKNNMDQEALQCWSISPDQMFQRYAQSLQMGGVLAVEAGGYVIWGNFESSYVLRIHIFSDQKSFGVVDSLRTLTRHLFYHYPLIKIYGVTPNRGFVKMSARAGWKHDGMLPKSFITNEGILKDQYILSAYREDYVTTKIQPVY
jgi:hypothetical protein